MEQGLTHSMAKLAAATLEDSTGGSGGSLLDKTDTLIQICNCQVYSHDANVLFGFGKGIKTNTCKGSTHIQYMKYWYNQQLT